MVEDENANALLGIGNFVEPLAQPLNDGAEGVLLDQVEQLLLGLEIIVEPGQGHAAGASKVAHGGAFVSFFVKDFGCMDKNLAEAAIETAHGR